MLLTLGGVVIPFGYERGGDIVVHEELVENGRGILVEICVVVVTLGLHSGHALGELAESTLLLGGGVLLQLVGGHGSLDGVEVDDTPGEVVVVELVGNLDCREHLRGQREERAARGVIGGLLLVSLGKAFHHRHQLVGVLTLLCLLLVILVHRLGVEDDGVERAAHVLLDERVGGFFLGAD